MSEESGVGALAGRRVVEFASECGAYCGKLFADMGADVVLIEPPGGDASRRVPPLADPDSPSSLSFLYRNAGKRSVAFDAGNAAERDALRRLMAAADIVVEAFAPGHLEACGFEFADLQRANPRLVLVSITGFGQSGPHRGWKSSDLIAAATGGALYVIGDGDDPPVQLAGTHSHAMASACAAASAMIALLHAERSGMGQRVDISMQEVVAAVCHIAGTGKWLSDGIVPRRMGSSLFASIPSGAYPCRDGLAYLMVNRPAHWQVLAQWIADETGETAVLDPMFAGPSSQRFPHRDLIDHFVAQLTRRHRVADVVREGQARHLSFTPVNRIAAVVADLHLAARGFFVDVEYQEGRRLRQPGSPLRMSATPAAIRSSAPAPGADTEAVLAQWQPRSAAVPVKNEAGDRPLTGVRVLEFTAGLAAPWVGRFMAYHGADVIKVESAARPDVTRQYVDPRHPELGVQSDASPWLTDWNAGKRCVALDLTRPGAAALALRLVGRADVVIENYATGVMDKLGLSHAALYNAKTDLIVFSTNGYGDRGPHSRYITWGPNLEAASGLAATSGFAHRDCTMTQYAYPDSLTALHGLFAVLAALDHRRRTGRGQVIHIAQLEATIAVFGEVLMETLSTGAEPAKRGNASPGAAPHGCYRCAGDDRWVAIAVFDESEWRSLCRIIGRHEWREKGEFAGAPARRARSTEIDAAISSWTAERDAWEAARLLQDAGVPAGVVATAADKFERDVHLRERGFFEAIHHDSRGTVIADGIPTGLTATPGRTPFAGRAIGADNEAVFVDLLGLSRAEYERFVAAGVIE